jgi:hypothetical protein
MWIRNVDTGKWYSQTDKLSKDNYDSLKQDIQAVKLYSKCLSGATYLMINDFNNIYNTLDINKIGYYIKSFPYSVSNFPDRGPQIEINSSNYEEFYQKYLKENAFTIKNLFTPTKLINTEISNYNYVDVATTTALSNITAVSVGLTIDGVRLIEGHRVLVKDQTTTVRLANTVNVESYFTNVVPVSNYYFVESFTTDTSYYYYNSDNGIYKYTNNQLVKESDLSGYDSSYKYSVVVKLGGSNREKQFHLDRLKNGYFPVQGQSVQFEEKHNWVLRNRVDYNNIYELNHYDILESKSTQVYSPSENFTYSIPYRMLAVGEFGVIINNQDYLEPSSTHSNSTIINSKYKVNLRSISETNDYYWVCGDEGTFLKIYKPDLSIERVDLKIFTPLTSVSFYSNLNGFVVGKFNKIFFTSDGGNSWVPVSFPELESFSYKKVLFYSLNKVYLAGETGIFIELTRDGSGWIAYKRKIYKTKGEDDYVLVDDINDLFLTNWVTIDDYTFVDDANSVDFANSLQIKHSIPPQYNYNTLKVDFSTKYSSNTTYESSNFYIGMSASSGKGWSYSNSNFNNYSPPFSSTQVQNDFIFYQDNGSVKNSFNISLPVDVYGNLVDDTYSFDIVVIYNYDAEIDAVSATYFEKTYSYSIKTTNASIVLLGCYDQVIVYDVENKLYKNGNDFIYFEFDQTIGEVRTIGKPKLSSNDRVYLGADKIYYFNLQKIINYSVSNNNFVTANIYVGPDLYVNRLYTGDKIYFAGNDSLLRFTNYSNIGNDNSTYIWDPNFNSRYKSKLLFLDYDIASKLNFFTDAGQYRMPSSVSIEQSTLTASGGYVEFLSIPGQTSWVDYYKDAEKTFEYYSFMNQSKVVQFSTTFSYHEIDSSFQITSSQISNKLSDIQKFAPTIGDNTKSEFFQGPDSIITTTDDYIQQPTTLSNYDVLIYKNIIIFKRGFNDLSQVGDILRLESDVLDCNLVINKILYYYQLSGQPFNQVSPPPNAINRNSNFEKYIYCYNTFNQNIINNLLNYSGNITIKNLNKYFDLSDLYDKFEKHPISIAYKLDSLSSNTIVSARFNNKTSYYNLATQVITPTITTQMVYNDAFLDFGFSPIYNIYDMLNRIDPVVFVGSKKFTILPEYYGLPGNNANTFTSGNIFIDQNITDNNKIYFGENFKLEWTSLLLWTFVDITTYNNDGNPTLSERMLITAKYYDSTTNGYVIEFHKRVNIPNIDGANPGISKLDILSRNILSQISSDLQLMNNIQRSQSQKSVQPSNTFYNYENDVKFKFPTDSYLKVLVSDFDIQQKVTGIIYTDYNYQICFNIINVERQIEYSFNSTVLNYGGSFSNKVSYQLTPTPQEEIRVGDLIYVQLTGITGSSVTENPQYQGHQTIIDITDNYITTSVDFGKVVTQQDIGIIKFIKKDAFLNYLPIDLFNVGQEKKPTRSVEIFPENVEFVDNVYNLVNVDTTKYKLTFVDGLSLQEVEEKFSWLLQSETSNAIIGRDDKGLVWYSGMWRCGRWFGGTWISGEWLGGDWYDGEWYAFNTKFKVISVQVDKNNSDNTISKWYGGRWFGGSWYDGTWYDGRRYDGDWFNGLWFNGTWNDGTWYNGSFQGGIWILGTWLDGKFNCDSKPSYWLDGKFTAGDFENGIWYNGQFGNDQKKLARFGTRSLNTRISTWHGGKWLSGEFHSFLNINDATGLPTVSDIHKYSVWRTGLWLSGDFYGGIAYNIDFKSGTWYGGILEEIQVVGVDKIYPATYSTNRIFVNGIFKFNPGDEVYILDDYRNNNFSPIGSNESPRKYRINKIIEDSTNSQTGLYLNYNLSTLGVDPVTGGITHSSTETGLRVVSHFKDSRWKSGLWTNGYFETGNFESGIWYNGVFGGIWSN